LTFADLVALPDEIDLEFGSVLGPTHPVFSQKF
jgi:hypothetical protein